MGKGCLFSFVAMLAGMLIIPLLGGIVLPLVKDGDPILFGERAFAAWIIVIVVPAFFIGLRLSEKGKDGKML
jgi:hypothetical protein